MSGTVLTLPLRGEEDVVVARQRARELAAAVGCDHLDQTRLATAVSEIARNVVSYAGSGEVLIAVEGSTAPQVLVVRVSDAGPGIADLGTILEGRYRSPTGMGRGIVGSRGLVDRFEIESRPGAGTTVTLSKLLPRRAGTVDAARLAERFPRGRHEGLELLDELRRQNQDLLQSLEELGRRQDELAALNRELEDTNRGVVALYAELDERADHLRRADELKSRFLSNMSHEFRTPVNSILALTRMLLDRADGDLSAEQDRQVSFIRKSAEALLELVNDLLDLAKVEAGKTEVRAVTFDVSHLFGALRGMLRPLLVSEAVALVFEEPDELPVLHTDEAKVSQVLRNLVSNALKFTERGEVRVTARHLPAERAVAFAVTDTGIGIAAEDQDRIFQEFTQVDSPVQRRVHGTGLGLPLCRKLASLLGGRVTVESTPGQGSTFTAVIPIHYQEVMPQAPEWSLEPDRLPVLVVEDAVDTILVYEKFFAGSHLQPLFARSVGEARAALTAFRPRAVVLDLLLRGHDSWSFLAELKRRDDTRDVPVVVVTTVDDERKALALGADVFFLKPVERVRFLQALTLRLTPELVRRVLVAEDEEVFRYLLRQHLTTPEHLVTEAATGAAALRLARSDRPDVICLDLGLPDLSGREVLARLKSDAATRDIPVVIVTSESPSSSELAALSAVAAEVLTKDSLSRESALRAIDRALGAGGG